MQVGHDKVAIFDQNLASSRVFNAATVRCYRHGAAGPSQVSTIVAGSSKWRSLLMAEDGRRSVYDKKPQRYAEDNRQNII